MVKHSKSLFRDTEWPFGDTERPFGDTEQTFGDTEQRFILYTNIIIYILSGLMCRNTIVTLS